MLAQYITIKNEIEDEIIVKKSRFIANIFYIKDEKDFLEKIEQVKRKYRDAKHHVFAYRLSNGKERYSDDGEPSGTAGVPILDILRGRNLYHVLVVVTRYFGGILLGTGGLVKAYSDVTKQALEKVDIKVKNLGVEYELEVPYNDYNIIQHYCSANHFIITNSSFLNTIMMQVIVKKEEEKTFLEEINELLDGKLNMKKIRENFYI